MFGNSIRLTHGGAAYHLSDGVAEAHLRERLQGDESAAFAIKAIENSQFDRQFKKVCDSVSQNRGFLAGQPTEIKLELFALFQ